MWLWKMRIGRGLRRWSGNSSISSPQSEKFSKKYARDMTASDWVALTVGLGNAFIILIGLIMARRHARQAVRPFMMSHMAFPDEDYGIGYVAFQNCGLGPAQIDKVTIYRNGSPYLGTLDEAFKAAVKDVGEKGGIKTKGWIDFQKGHVIPKDGNMLIGRFRCVSETSDVDTRNELRRLKIQIEVHYRDMYGKKNSQIDPKDGGQL